MDVPKTAPPATPAATPRTEDSGAPAEDPRLEIARLRTRLSDVQRERDHLIAVVEILQEISGSLHFADILQTIARKLGDTFRLDRCAIFLTGENDEVRLVASYEDPNIRNLVVDVNRYPELKRVFGSGETVFIPDAMTDPALAPVRMQLELRKVRAIVVVPLEWQGTIIGAIFVRTNRDARAFTDADVQFCAMVASLTAKALRNAHRFESLMKQQQHTATDQRTAELQRIALVAFLRRLLDRYARVENQAFAEGLLPKASDEELERLVGVAMQVIEEEAKG
jgi:GAF domain-containing protein